jgi:hypothetical protein
MAHSRMLVKKISVSTQVNKLSSDAKLLFTWAIPHADDLGFLPYDHDTLKALIMPMKGVEIEEFGQWINEIVTNKLWEVFSYKEDSFYKITKFTKHQKLRKDRQPSTYLNIDVFESPKKTWDKVEVELGLQVKDSSCNTVMSRYDSDKPRYAEVKRIEENGSEEKANEGKRREYKFPDVGPSGNQVQDSDSENQSFIDLGEIESGAPEILEKKSEDPVNQILNIFHDTINPGIKFVNAAFRRDAKKLIDDIGLDRALKAAWAAVSIQGESKYAPVITDPSRLLEKMSVLRIYLQKKSIPEPEKKGFVIIA